MLVCENIKILITWNILTISFSAGKIIYDRYQQVHILGSLTINPNVTSFANRIATCSAAFLSLGFLVYFFLFLFKVRQGQYFWYKCHFNVLCILSVCMVWFTGCASSLRLFCVKCVQGLTCVHYISI